jgi:hypothetical protein
MALLWLGVIAPLRAEQESRLARQRQVRSDRLRAERALEETQTLRARTRQALRSGCRASSDPAALRQRTVAATAGLALGPVSLSVSGAAGGGAVIEAEGEYRVVAELLRRLGDPGRGGFLRSASLRYSRGRWSASASTGALESFPAALMSPPAPCPSLVDPGPDEISRKSAIRARPAEGRKAAVTSPQPASSAPELMPASTPPFTLVAFLTGKGKSRVSVVIRGEVRVVSVGDDVDEWTCVSIDGDEGAVFTSSSGGRLTLKAGS